MNNINEILSEAYWKELNKEGIQKEDLDLIMLNIEYSPVTPIKGGDPCEVVKTQGGKKYIVRDTPFGDQIVDEETLKVMRYRYLQFDPGRIAQRNAINNFFKKD